jgi:hypothetical protein
MNVGEWNVRAKCVRTGPLAFFAWALLAIMLWLINQFLNVVARELLKKPGETFAVVIRNVLFQPGNIIKEISGELESARKRQPEPENRPVAFYAGCILGLISPGYIISGKIFGFTATNLETAWMFASQIVPLFLIAILIGQRWPTTPNEPTGLLVGSGFLMMMCAAFINTTLSFIPIRKLGSLSPSLLHSVSP